VVYDEAHQIAGYARILAKDTIYDKATIGRVLTSKTYRQTGLGREVFRLAVASLLERLGEQAIKIQAQSYLLTFYESFGFKSISDAYLDTGILHNDMVRTI
jgi:ElaA protein